MLLAFARFCGAAEFGGSTLIVLGDQGGLGDAVIFFGMSWWKLSGYALHSWVSVLQEPPSGVVFLLLYYEFVPIL
ncbi:hypothetical protein Pyn_39538 [Prunus yedoensis var. nudiflora]|uniref:Uncharacterized protein n=1 Tax=Prunus yedoensis var. nudiflora TaxID=2094558 RepID=A0A314Z839_PRUYE|nr:hypothetical protein Pyn_39538 [Prunus yedoensis var. nudiflora]